MEKLAAFVFTTEIWRWGSWFLQVYSKSLLNYTPRRPQH